MLRSNLFNMINDMVTKLMNDGGVRNKQISWRYTYHGEVFFDWVTTQPNKKKSANFEKRDDAHVKTPAWANPSHNGFCGSYPTTSDKMKHWTTFLDSGWSQEIGVPHCLPSAPQPWHSLKFSIFHFFVPSKSPSPTMANIKGRRPRLF